MAPSLIETIYRHSLNTPDKLCVTDTVKDYSYAGFFKAAVKVSRALKALGTEKGDRIVALCTQDADFLVLQGAVQLCGAVFVPLEKSASEETIDRIVKDTDAVLYLAGGIRSVWEALKAECPEEQSFSEDDFNGLPGQPAAFEAEIKDIAFPEGSDIAEILYTTGTTGKSKGVVLTHSASLACAENVEKAVNIKNDNVELIVTPLNHSFSLRRYYANMLAGGTAVILNGVLNIKKYYGAMDKYGVTAMALVPAVITVLMKLSKGKLSEYASVIRYAQVGSAPMTDGQKDFLRTMLPGVPLYNIFGSTEAGCSSCFDFSSDKDYAGCIGRANVNARIFFVDENRNPIEATKEAPGLMVTTGSHIMNGYYNDPEETALALIDGAIYSKDLGYTDEEGFICIIGRKGDVINVHGHKVAPEEVEGLALKIEGIADCICTGISDGQGSQVVKLYYVPEGEGADPKAIRDFLAERLESYKVPREIETIPKVPRTFNGKIDRKVFKDR